MSALVTCGNCRDKHTVALVRACYAARYSADAPRGYVASKAPSAPVQPVQRPDATAAATSQREAAERLQGAAYKRRGKAAPLKGAGLVRLLGKSREESEALAAQAVREGCPF